MIELMFRKELMLMKQLNQKKCMLCHYCNFFNFKFLTLVMDPIFGMVAII